MLCASFVVQGSTGCRSFVVQSCAGKFFVQALKYKVVLGNLLANFEVQNSTGKDFVQLLRQEVFCASFAAQSTGGKCSVQAS